MSAFVGFPAKSPYVPVPEVFFTQLLPQIEDIVELKVTLHLFWLLAHKEGSPRCASDRELLRDALLLNSLKSRGDPRLPEEKLRQGLRMAVSRGTLLRVELSIGGPDTDNHEVAIWYFFNTARSRKVVKELEGGEVISARLLNTQVQQEEAAMPAGEYRANGSRSENVRAPLNVQVQQDRPNVFVLYEQNIGLLTPFIADQLRDALEHYPVEWIEAAMREAALYNKRNWNYISAILRRWETEGRQPWNA